MIVIVDTHVKETAVQTFIVYRDCEAETQSASKFKTKTSIQILISKPSETSQSRNFRTCTKKRKKYKFIFGTYLWFGYYRTIGVTIRITQENKNHTHK